MAGFLEDLMRHFAAADQSLSSPPRSPLQIDPAAQQFGASGPGPLTVMSGPSAKFNPPGYPTDPRAHTVQLVDKGGSVHYRGEVTQEGDGLWGIGYVENVSRQTSGQAAKLYQSMAKYVEDMGGTLVAGMNTNKYSQAVLNKLQDTGLATPIDVGGRLLFKINSKPTKDSNK